MSELIENELKEIGETLIAIGLLMAPDKLSTAVDEEFLLDDSDGIMTI